MGGNRARTLTADNAGGFKLDLVSVRQGNGVAAGNVEFWFAGWKAEDVFAVPVFSTVWYLEVVIVTDGSSPERWVAGSSS